MHYHSTKKNIYVLLVTTLGAVLVLSLLWLLGDISLPLVRAASFTVTRPDDPAPPGSCDPGDCSLREAIIAANSNGQDDTIILAAQTYTLSITGMGENAAAQGDLDITEGNELRIVGQGSNQTFIDANGIDRIFDVRPGAGQVTIEDVAILNGAVTGESGGGIRNTGADLVLINTVVYSNVAHTINEPYPEYYPGYGGGIFVDTGSVTLNGGQVISNTAGDPGRPGSGGGVYADSGTLTITGAQISNNYVHIGRGGGVCVNSGLVTLDSGQISSNFAQFGGGTYIGSGGNAVLSGGQIRDNNSRWGGGVYIGSNGSATFSGGQISGNTATSYGGGVFVGGPWYGGAATFTQTGGAITNNNAQGGGGGIWVNAGALILDGGQISDNSAQTIGGGIRLGGAVLTQTGTTTIINNTAGTNGGGIYVDGRATFTGLKIIGNQADTGAGVYVARGSNPSDFGMVTIDTGLVGNNSATTFGGGVYVASGSATLDGGTVQNNTAANGGALYLEQSSGAITMTYGCIMSNTDTSVFRNDGSLIATNNWWGASDGPSGVGPGSGDSVSANVSFSPFQAARPATCFTYFCYLPFIHRSD